LLDALEDFGLTPELLNRLTAVLAIPPPRLGDLIRAATADNGVIAGYNRLLIPGGCRLRFEATAVQEMAARCISSRLYYRGLASVVSSLAADAIHGGRSVTVKATDIQRAVERLDEAANDLLAHARLTQTDLTSGSIVDGITDGLSMARDRCV
jgi:ATP-dependent protease Clp ATPase subunit